MSTSEAMCGHRRACDAGKSAACPDIVRAILTWKFAIAHLARAGEEAFDANAMKYVAQIQSDTDAYMVQMSEDRGSRGNISLLRPVLMGDA